jgi:hypothetical protein
MSKNSKINSPNNFENSKKSNSKFEKLEKKNNSDISKNFDIGSGEVYDVNCPDDIKSIDTMDDEDEATGMYTYTPL